MPRMKKIGRELKFVLGEIESDSEANRKQARAIQVKQRYKHVVTAAFPQSYELVLYHTNSVYIVTKDGVKNLIVYVDESIFAAELNAQRELMKLMFKQMFDEDIQQFDIYVSRGKYKKQHPFQREEKEEKSPAKRPLDERERKQVEDTLEIVENEKLKEVMKKAMTASFESKKR